MAEILFNTNEEVLRYADVKENLDDSDSTEYLEKSEVENHLDEITTQVNKAFDLLDDFNIYSHPENLTKAYELLEKLTSDLV